MDARDSAGVGDPEQPAQRPDVRNPVGAEGHWRVVVVVAQAAAGVLRPDLTAGAGVERREEPGVGSEWLRHVARGRDLGGRRVRVAVDQTAAAAELADDG